MTPRDRALLVLGSGVLLGWMGLTDVMYRYLRPSMQRWVVLSALGLVVLGAALFISDVLEVRRTHEADHDHAHGGHGTSKVGWLLLAPLLIAIVVNPGALGAYTVDRATPNRLPAFAPFDLAEHLEVNSYGGQDVELDLYQLWSASSNPEEAPLLTDVPLRITGFIVHDSGEVMLARLVVGCCAADALPMVAVLDGDLPPELAVDDTWVEVHGTYDAAASVPLGDTPDSPAVPVLSVTAINPVDKPELPYIYPS